MSDPDGDDEWIEDRIAFEARFPLEAFEPIAKALGKSTEQRSLEALRSWLLPDFNLFYMSCVGIEPSRNDRLNGLKELRDAAAVVNASLRPGGIRKDLPWDLLKAANAQFRGLVERLGQAADAEAQRLAATPSRRGRPPNLAFRELACELVRVYERVTGHEAVKPHWLRDSRMYGSEFYSFAVAVWGCLRDGLPEAQCALPKSKGALAEALQDHWPKDRTATGGKVP
jgi:hypothetical protein